MARPHRIFIPDVPVHVVFRGTNRQAIFRDEADCIYLHREFSLAAARNGLAVHAYVFMPNHVHLLATGTGPGSLPKTIQDVGRKYVRNFNDRYGRVGALWQGRYWSALVDCARYYLTCHRYVELNPIRAGLASAAGKYRWSSHASYALGIADDLVTPHATFIALAESTRERRASFLELFDDPVGEEDLKLIRSATIGYGAYGSAAFHDRVRLAIGRNPRRGRRASRQPAGAPRAQM